MHISPVAGTVIQGRGTSHTIGFPTINIQQSSPKHMGGTWRVNVSINNVIYAGVGPHFPDRGLREIHILGYTGDAYGKEVSIFPLKKMRENISFDSKETLIQQLHLDIKTAKTTNIVGLSFGTFDYFHPGHEQYLLQAKQRCDTLVTIVARDTNVTLLKRKQANYDEQTRLQHVLDSGIPNIAVLGDAHDHFLCLKTYTPDVICLGYDQIGFSEGLQEFYTRQGLELPNIVRLKACNADKRKSTLIAKSS